MRIEHYRNSHNVADPTSALGERQRELRARGAYDQARSDLQAAKARLELERGRTQRPRPARSHGLGR